MDRARWDRIQQLFHGANELPAPERQAYLASECPEDPNLVAEVTSLLDEDARGASLLDHGLAPLAGHLVGDTGETAIPVREFGAYRVLEVVGQGGMGIVYLAERADLGHRVAIKVLRDAALSPARRDRFASEQRTLAQLNHPSIAQLHDADALPDGTPWFAMEYVEGLPLTEYCEARRTSLEGRLLILRSVCQAVQHAHSHLVVHRDLKPSNVLVRNDGTVKLLDFGIAKQLESLDVPVDQTKTGFRLMTPAYAAPEQLRGDRIGIHTDVYSLGVLLYELLTGRLPFDLSQATPAEAERLITEQEPERPSAVTRRAGPPWDSRSVAGASAWADLDVLCLTAMHKDPQRRYRTVDAFIQDIDHFLAGEPLEARPDSLRYRTGKFMRRNRQSVVAASVVIAVLVALVGFYTVRLAQARDTALAGAARTDRIQRFMLNLFHGGDAQVGPADSLRVVTLLDRGVQEAGSLVGEPAVQAELMATLGGLYQQLGRLDRADSLIVAALEQRRSLHGAEHPDVAESEIALGLLRLEQAEYDVAEETIRAGLARLQRLQPADHPSIARAMTALGKVLEEQGDYDQAIATLEEAVRLQSTREIDADLIESLTELGNTNFYAGNYPTADSIFRQVLEYDRQLYGDRHPAVANDLINVGAVLHERGNYAEAERYYREALDINVGFYGNDHPATADNLTGLSRALLFQRKLAEADTVIRRALIIQERVYGENHPRVASTVNELGSVALMQDRLADAEAAYRRMADIYRVAYPNGHYLVGIALSNLATVQLNRELYVEAEQQFREAVRVFSQTLSPEHLNTGIARIKLGRALVRQRRYAEAAAESRAGYDSLAPQTDPQVSWLKTARGDLVEAYQALGREEDADRFRDEMSDTSRASP